MSFGWFCFWYGCIWSVGKSDWEPQFILRCRREISKDLRLVREINALCMRLTAIVDEREVFADELDMLAGKHVEFEIRAQEKELFIEKLKGIYSTLELESTFSKAILTFFESYVPADSNSFVSADVIVSCDILEKPDITFAVSACAKNQVSPIVSNLNAVKRIFKYIKGHPKLVLWYPRDSPFDLEAFSDSDYVGAAGDRKSTTGGCQFMDRRYFGFRTNC
nr:uncharacterized mitochondrial protein AtMg00810-like [Tanacetum cinerariifolium]